MNQIISPQIQNQALFNDPVKALEDNAKWLGRCADAFRRCDEKSSSRRGEWASLALEFERRRDLTVAIAEQFKAEVA
jgi:hypothetical protein